MNAPQAPPPGGTGPDPGPDGGPGRGAGAPSGRGLFVVFEGGDGAGKTTQSRRLVDALSARGHDVTVTREPGGTELGAGIRGLVLHGGHVAPRAEALLFAADRAHHVATVVRPALAVGRVVVSDRYLDSSVAYQGAGRDLPASEIRDLSLWATDGLVPDLTVLLDVAPETGRGRIGARAGGEDRMEAEPGDFHARVRAHFLDLAASDPGRYVVLDAGRDPDELAAVVLDRVDGLLQPSRRPGGVGS